VDGREHGMKRFLIPVAAAVTMAMLATFFAIRPSAGEDTVRLTLAEAGWKRSMRDGIGIYLTIQPQRVPEGGLSEFKPGLQNLCNHFAPNVVASVWEQIGRTDPSFVDIVISSGGFISSNLRATFKYQGGKCVE
jgi:hypothetical protein